MTGGSDLDTLIALARHERPDVSQRALDMLRAECDRLRDAGEWEAFARFMIAIWERDPWLRYTAFVDRVIVADEGEGA